ncbi:SHOCT domain-containing protein [Cellulosimicrobium arenosum]|uniref:SHOCT domain-containing protein n=1 Tax=Cellulosimicrobium arenosum TaxID=2708133 RepID=A0A927J0H8_9MICO|nr:SHOCT domain-containing protein [Cellulosimicrobium arenosum]
MPGLLRGVARTAAIAGTATAVSNRVSRRQAGRWAAQQPAEPAPTYAAPPPTYAQPAYAPPPPASSGTDARIEQLTQLAALRDQGVLSPAEFEAEKARILAD